MVNKVYEMGRIIWLHNHIYENIVEELFNRRTIELKVFFESVKLLKEKDIDWLFEVDEIEEELNREGIEYSKKQYKISKNSLALNGWFNKKMKNFIEFKTQDITFYLNDKSIIDSESFNIMFHKTKKEGEISISNLSKINDRYENDQPNWDEWEFFALFYYNKKEIATLNKYRNFICHSNDDKIDHIILNAVKNIIESLISHMSNTLSDEEIIYFLRDIYNVFPEFFKIINRQ